MEKLIEILKSYHPEVDFYSCNTLIDDKILDSYDVISLLADIYEEFGTRISPDDIISANFNSAESIYKLIRNYSDIS